MEEEREHQELVAKTGDSTRATLLAFFVSLKQTLPSAYLKGFWEVRTGTNKMDRCMARCLVGGQFPALHNLGIPAHAYCVAA